MPIPALSLRRFLLAVLPTRIFAEYRVRRGIPSFRVGGEDRVEAVRRFDEVLASLPEHARADVREELRQASELAARGAVGLLIDACCGEDLPPGLGQGDEADALAFLVHRPGLFREVYLHEEVLGAGAWHAATVEPGLDLADHADRRAAFGAEIRRFAVRGDGTGRVATTRSCREEDSGTFVFLGRVGRARTRPGRSRNGQAIVLAYHPHDGTLLLRAGSVPPNQVRPLFESLARSVLGVPLGPADPSFDLERLKRPFDPPVPPEIATVRVKTLELVYPAAHGRRRVRLETNAADSPGAVYVLLARHFGDGDVLDRTRVGYAELLIQLRAADRPRCHTVRLWPQRSNLDHSPTGLLIRRCLASWHLVHAPRP